jgi:hypothetical protein
MFNGVSRSMSKFKPGDLIKPKPNTGWNSLGVILAEVLSADSHWLTLYTISILVSTNTTTGFTVGSEGRASEEFFDHV